ncbi:MAG: NAD(P)-binding domain-containing protein [Deltaproteobacteria bacterium]|nr:NAD(P)-binding domain-containing protein [Deltaproteobacteria bacterium]
MKILFCGVTFVSAVDHLKKLLPEHEVVNCPNENLISAARDAQVLIPLMAKIDRSVLEVGPPMLVQQWGVGLEGVDIESATELGVKVCNVPGDTTPNADSTAEHAVFLMMGLSRKIRDCFLSLRNGVCGTPVGQALFGRRALIVGFGKVGQALARKLTALGMQVDVIRRTAVPNLEKEIGVNRTGDSSELLDMARTADFVISTVTLTNVTRNLFDMSLFTNMKTSAFVVNVSRGPVINENELISALNNHLIAGAGLDVFATEPVDIKSPLLFMENVLATPHIAGVTEQNYVAIGELVKENILRVTRGERPNYCVNC